MAKMGRYCKAYQVIRFREFDGWTEASQNARKVARPVDGVELDGIEVEGPRPLTDGDILYLQDNFTVTDGIYLEENIIFDQVTPEWTDFCKNSLGFEIPSYQAARAAAAE